MHNQCVIIILTFITGNEINTGEICGTLSSPPVKEGQNAHLEYIPYGGYSNHRKWLHNPGGTEHLLVFDSGNTTFMSDKYSEFTTDKGFILTIKEVTFKNAEGSYAVVCREHPWVYSNPVRLNVSRAESATSIPSTHKGFTTNRQNVNITNFMTSKLPSTTAVYITTTQRQEVTPTTIHLPNTHRSSTDEGKSVSITSIQPSTTAVNSVITIEKKVTSYKKENEEESIKQIPDQSTTEKEKEKTFASTEKGSGINIKELKLLIPITVSVVGIVVAVAIATVCLTVRKKRNKETQLRPEVASDDNEETDGRLPEDVRGLMLSSDVVQEQAIPSYSEARSDVLAQACEPPEYASVIPKEKSVCEAKQNINKTKTSLICDNTETENQLVYAELDLQPVSNIRPTTSRYEATEYVSVDFSKTRTSQANTDIPDQQDTTEYVSVDFSKTGTPQANTVLPEQTDTTEHVSVDFSKTAELQTEDQGDGK